MKTSEPELLHIVPPSHGNVPVHTNLLQTGVEMWKNLQKTVMKGALEAPGRV